MGTIEERAKEYADRRLKGVEIDDFGVATVYGYKDIYNANMAAYKTGSKEQKAIDIEKAENAFNKACGWLSTFLWYNGVFEEFIKALEE